MQPHIPHHSHILHRPSSSPRRRTLLSRTFLSPSILRVPRATFPYCSLYPLPDANRPTLPPLNPAVSITPFSSHFTRPTVHDCTATNRPQGETCQNTQFSQPNEVLASLTKAPTVGCLCAHKLGILQQPAPRYCTAQYLTEPLRRRSQRAANAHRERRTSH